MATPSLSRALDGVRLHVVTGKGGVGKTTVAAGPRAGPLPPGQAGAARRGRGPPGHQPDLRRRPARHRGGAPASPTPAAARCGASRSTPRPRCSSTSRSSTSSAAPAGPLERMGVIDFATTIAPGVRDVLLTGKVYEAVGRTTGTRRHQGPQGLGCRRARRAAHGPRSPASSTSTCRWPTSPGWARSTARPSRSPGCCATAERRARRHPARGDAGAGDRRRHRRAVGRRLRPRRRRRQPGARAAASTRRCSRPPAAEPQRVAARVRDDLAAVGVRAGHADGERAARRGARPRRAGRARALPDRRGRRARGCPTLTLPRARRAASRTAASRVLADVLIDQGVR